MLYLLDANVLIDANRDYYPLGRVPEFWDWLLDCANLHQVKIPMEMYEEILAGKDDGLTRWAQGQPRCSTPRRERRGDSRGASDGAGLRAKSERGGDRTRRPRSVSHRLRVPRPIPADCRHDGGIQAEEAARESAHPGRVRCSGRAPLQHLRPHSRAGFLDSRSTMRLSWNEIRVRAADVVRGRWG